MLYSKLETDYYLLGEGGMYIVYNDDLNSYNNVGNYYCPQNDRAESLQNCPINLAFSMKIELPTGWGEYVCQTIRTYTTGNIYYRFRTGGVWQNWNAIESKSLAI